MVLSKTFFLKDITVGSYKESAIHCNMFYENPGNFIPVIRNIWVENLNVTSGGDYAIFINAYKESPVRHLQLVNCSINGIKQALKVDHVEGMKFERVTINGQLFTDPAK